MGKLLKCPLTNCLVIKGPGTKAVAATIQAQASCQARCGPHLTCKASCRAQAGSRTHLVHQAWPAKEQLRASCCAQAGSRTHLVHQAWPLLEIDLPAVVPMMRSRRNQVECILVPTVVAGVVPLPPKMQR